MGLYVSNLYIVNFVINGKTLDMGMGAMPSIPIGEYKKIEVEGNIL